MSSLVETAAYKHTPPYMHTGWEEGKYRHGGVNCQLNRIWNDLGDRSLSMHVGMISIILVDVGRPLIIMGGSIP